MNLKIIGFGWFLLLTFSGVSQHFNSQNNWRKYKHEISVGTGIANYMGDLGGLDTQGKEFFLFDLEFSQFKKSFACSYRYNAFKNASFHGKVFYGTVSGSDALTRQPQRTARNLSFKSNIIECSASYE